MSPTEILDRILHRPSLDDLWALQPTLLALNTPEAKEAREIAHRFYCYVSKVESKLTSKRYSTLAARLAGASVGVIAAQDIVESLALKQDGALGDLLAGGLAGVLEVLSSLNSVKAWEREFASAHREAAWDLYTALWCVSVETQPALPAERRQALLDPLFAVIRSDEIDDVVRMALIIRLYQIVLAIRLAPLVAAQSPPTVNPS